MQMLVLAAFIVTLVLTDPQVLWGLASGGWRVAPGGWHVAPAAAIYLLGAAAIGAAHVAVALRALDRGEAPGRCPWLGVLLAGLVPAWLLAGQGVLLVCGYGRWVMEDLALAGVPLAGEALAAGPFVAALLIVWLLEYPIHRRLRRAIAMRVSPAPAADASWSLRQYVGYRCRHGLLFVAVPIGAIVLVRGLLYLFLAPHLPAGSYGEWLWLAAMVTSALAIFFFSPVLLVRIWRTRRLPDGPLRDDLEAVCRRLKLRCRDILVWQTGGMVANAAVMGLAAPVRYILLSDALLENLPARSIESIFAHEAGHIASHHIFYAVVFTVATVGLCQGAAEAAARMLGWTGPAVELGALAVVGAVWVVAFGWVSRRFERQSDVTAAWLSGLPAASAGSDADRITHEGAAVFAGALERVASLNGAAAQKRNWRHGSVADRVGYILWLGGTGATRRGIDRVVRRIKVAVWLLFLAAAAAVVGLGLAAP